MFDAVVVGGGAAGMMAAITAAERGKHVLLLEKNAQLGRKIRITGKGRCNVTNNCEPRTVIESTPGNGRFLYGAVNHFTPQDTMDFFEGLGVPLKEGFTTADYIAKYAMPYDIEFRPELPKTLVGKVAYRVLEEEEAERQALEDAKNS